MSRAVASRRAAVHAAVAAVPDPELPGVTIGMLGMVHSVRVEGRTAVVELLPTYSGCPATEVITADVRAAATATGDVRAVEVRLRYDPPWTSARIDADGRAALAALGIAPPRQEEALGGDGPLLHEPGARRLPLVGAAAVPCPYCDSVDTVRDSPFGPTPCRDLRYCNGCRQPFEAFRG